MTFQSLTLSIHNGVYSRNMSYSPTIYDKFEKGKKDKTLHRTLNKGNNKITELRTILQRESQNS